MLGLQTAFSIVVQTMVEPGLLDWRGVAKVMSERPAEITGLSDHGRPIAVGEPANLALVDPETEWTVESGALASLSENSPFDGLTLPGVVVATVLRGEVTNHGGKVRAPR